MAETPEARDKTVRLLLDVIRRFLVVYADDRPAYMIQGRPIGHVRRSRYRECFRLARKHGIIPNHRYSELNEAIRRWPDQPPIVREAVKLLHDYCDQAMLDRGQHAEAHGPDE